MVFSHKIHDYLYECDNFIFHFPGAFQRSRCMHAAWPSLRLRPGLKVTGLSPQILAQPPAQGEWGGRLMEGIRERGKW